MGQHVTIAAVFPVRVRTPVFSQARWLKGVERVTSWPSRMFIRGGRKISQSWAQPLLDLRARLGLKYRGNPLFEGQHSPHLVLALWSRVLGAPQADWPQNVTLTGAMFYDACHGATLRPEVEEFVTNDAVLRRILGDQACRYLAIRLIGHDPW